MADLFDFEVLFPIPENADRKELVQRLEVVRAQLDRLDKAEPEDMDSEEYEAWGNRHETLEDLADELLDRLDELDA